MNGEEYKKNIIEMLTQIDDEALLKRIYLIFVTALKADH